MPSELLEEGDEGRETIADAMPGTALVQSPRVGAATGPRVTHRVEITPTRLGNRGQRYSVTYRGALLIAGTRTPAFAACRALLARGITGRLQVWRPGKSVHDMQLDIERGAGVMITETDAHGLQVVPWRPFAQDTAERVAFVQHPSAGGDLASALGFP
jgi:hypothetical protein